MNDGTYAGDLTPGQTWQILKNKPKISLLDVRTTAEWAYVGLPDLTSLGHEPVLVSWILFPEMQKNPGFVEQVLGSKVDPREELLIMCRSGQRSKSAAKALSAAGFEACYNILFGFEGDKNSNGHRGTINGWKVENLPWLQG